MFASFLPNFILKFGFNLQWLQKLLDWTSNFLKIAYREVDKKISRIAIHKLCNHMWYLAPETAAVAFFDDEIGFDSKKRMMKALDKIDTSENSVKKFEIFPNGVENFLTKDIENFISQKTRGFFDRFSIPMDFSQKDPLEWEDDNSFQIELEIIKKNLVVNDIAERGVGKLMEDYNKILSRSEEEKQYILQIISEHRKKYPDSMKSTLTPDL